MQLGGTGRARGGCAPLSPPPGPGLELLPGGDSRCSVVPAPGGDGAGSRAPLRHQSRQHQRRPPNRVRPGASGDGGVRGVGSRARRQRKHELRGVPAASPKKRFVRSPQEHGGPLPRAPSPVRRVVVVVRRTSRTRPASAELKKMLPHLRREPRLRVKGVLRGGGDEPGGPSRGGGGGRCRGARAAGCIRPLRRRHLRVLLGHAH
mmetsp:Transcript_33695/g.63464  ORF Transcript_33695/g.63464 Transcript_33695/m.63464 type:complete len:205 (-) Transcript_33695:622-1236(-)